MALLLLLGIILAISILVIWFIPFVVRKATKNTRTVRPLGLVCFLVMTAIVVGIGYACVFGGESLSNIFDRLGKAMILLPILWIASAWGMIAQVPNPELANQKKLSDIRNTYKKFLETNDIDLLVELFAWGEIDGEKTISLLKQHPEEGKIILDCSLLLLESWEAKPQEEADILVWNYYITGYLYEEGIGGNVDVPRAIEMYTKALNVPCYYPQMEKNHEECQAMAKKRLDQLTNKNNSKY